MLREEPLDLQLVLLGFERAGRIDQETVGPHRRGDAVAAGRWLGAPARQSAGVHALAGVGMPGKGAGAEAGRVEQDGVDRPDRRLLAPGRRSADWPDPARVRFSRVAATRSRLRSPADDPSRAPSNAIALPPGAAQASRTVHPSGDRQ